MMAGYLRKCHILLIVLLLAGLSSCNELGSAEKEKEQTVKIGYVFAGSDRAVAYMWGTILEEKGYRVSIKKVRQKDIWRAIARGKVDFYMSAMLPIHDKKPLMKQKNEIDVGEPWYKGAFSGLIVPKGSGIESIPQLKKKQTSFSKAINVPAIDERLQKSVKKAIKTYKLKKYHVQLLTPQKMNKRLEKGNRPAKNPVFAVTYPRDLVIMKEFYFLKDPESIFSKGEKLYYVGREGFRKQFPRLALWFDRWEMNARQLQSLTGSLQKASSPKKGAKRWVAENGELVSEWMRMKGSVQTENFK